MNNMIRFSRTLRTQKDEAIAKLVRAGRKHKRVKSIIFAVIAVLLFFYYFNRAFLASFTRKSVPRSVLATAMIAVLVIASVPAKEIRAGSSSVSYYNTTFDANGGVIENGANEYISDSFYDSGLYIDWTTDFSISGSFSFPAESFNERRLILGTYQGGNDLSFEIYGGNGLANNNVNKMRVYISDKDNKVLVNAGGAVNESVSTSDAVLELDQAIVPADTTVAFTIQYESGVTATTSRITTTMTWEGLDSPISYTKEFSNLTQGDTSENTIRVGARDRRDETVPTFKEINIGTVSFMDGAGEITATYSPSANTGLSVKASSFYESVENKIYNAVGETSRVYYDNTYRSYIGDYIKFEDGAYLDTGYQIDWSKSFEITGVIRKELASEVLCISSDSGDDNAIFLQSGIDSGNQSYVSFHDPAEYMVTETHSMDVRVDKNYICYIIQYDASTNLIDCIWCSGSLGSESYWYLRNSTEARIIADTDGTSTNTLYIGTRDAAGNVSGSTYAQKSLKIYVYEDGVKTLVRDYEPLTNVLVQKYLDGEAVTYTENKCTDFSNAIIRSGEALASYMPVPSREGYTFLGWYTQSVGGTLAAASDTVSANQILYAHWQANETNVTLNSNGGTLNGSVTETYDAGAGMATAPVRQGYTVAGYYLSAEETSTDQILNADGSFVVDVNGNNVINDAGGNPVSYVKESVWNYTNTGSSPEALTLYAHWTANVSSVTIKKDGVKDTGRTVELYQGGTKQYDSSGLDNGNYVFHAVIDGTYDIVVDGIDSGKDLTVSTTGSTQIDYYTISAVSSLGSTAAVSNDGTNFFASVETREGANVYLKVSNADDYSFAGWYDTSGALISSEQTTSAVTVTGTQTFTAVYSKNCHVITQSTDGSVLTQDTAIVSGSSLTLTAPMQTGYNFNGWKIMVGSSSGSFAAGSLLPSGTIISYTEISAISGGALTLNADWSPITYSITYAPDGGTLGTLAPVNTAYNTAFTVSDPVKLGYQFSGWSISGSAVNSTVARVGEPGNVVDTISFNAALQESEVCNIYNGSTAFLSLSSTQGASITLNAHWSGNMATVSVYADGVLDTASHVVQIDTSNTALSAQAIELLDADYGSLNDGIYRAVSTDVRQIDANEVYYIWVDGACTNRTIELQGNQEGTAQVYYYTAVFSCAEAGQASGSTITATSNGVQINSGDLILAGAVLVVTMHPAGADLYAYSWQKNGIAAGSANTLTLSNVQTATQVSCTVTGTNVPVPTTTPVPTVTPTEPEPSESPVPSDTPEQDTEMTVTPTPSPTPRPIPFGQTTSQVEMTGNNLPSMSVGGIDQLFDESTDNEDDTKGYTTQDRTIVEEGGGVEIVFDITELEDPNELEDLLLKYVNEGGQTIGVMADLSLIKTTWDADGSVVGTHAITETSSLVQLIIPLTDEMKAGSNLTLYRYHGTEAEILSESPNAYGESAYRDGDDFICNLRRFSTYVVAYTPANGDNTVISETGDTKETGAAGNSDNHDVLPQTGSDSTVFYISGVVLMISGAELALWFKRKTRAVEE